MLLQFDVDLYISFDLQVCLSNVLIVGIFNVHNQQYHSGYTGAFPFGSTDADKPNKPVLLGDVSCNGDEATIGECSATVYSLQEGKDLLATVDIAGITCLIPSNCDVPPTGGTECQEGDTRLTGDDGESKGNLEYCYNGFWSPSCALSEIDASVACKEFGFTNYTCELWTTLHCGPI